jgi:hypothetical protein
MAPSPGPHTILQSAEKGQPVALPGARKELSEALIYNGYFPLPD